MKKESGKSIVSLLFLIILILVGAYFIVNYAKQLIEESNKQDIRTNMLLMQAETKKGVEEVCVQTVNLKESNAEQLEKINEVKSQYLKGKKLKEAPLEVQEAIKNIPEITLDENSYYLDVETLEQIGIKNYDENLQGYFIVKYDFVNANVEVINTKGLDGKYILSQIVEEIDKEIKDEVENKTEVIEEAKEDEIQEGNAE